MRKSTPMAKLTENSGRGMPAPITHRNEFPTGYSLAGCSPAEPTSAFPADLILQPEIPFVMEFPANGNCRSTVCLKEGRSPLRAATKLTTTGKLLKAMIFGERLKHSLLIL